MLATAVLINTVGTGLYSTSSALYFTRSAGLAIPLVGIGLTVAALVGLLVGIPAGHLADRWDPRWTWVATLVGETITMAAFAIVHSFAFFLVIACLNQLAASGGASARTPVIRRIGTPDPARFRAYLRSVTNVGIGLGALAAAAAIQVGTRPAYVSLILGNAVSFSACALVVLMLPKLPPLPVPEGAGRWLALRDAPYTAITAVNGVISLAYPVLTFALPLWIADHTRAPRFLVAASVLINTIIVILFQVRASRGVVTPRSAGKAMRTASLALLASFFLIAVLPRFPALAASLILVAAVIVYTFGELQQAAASFELSFGLAPAHAQGMYGGMFGMGQQLAIAAGPSALAALCLGLKAPGWLILGAIMTVVGFLTPVLVRWAERTRAAFFVETTGADSLAAHGGGSAQAEQRIQADGQPGWERAELADG